MLCLGDCKVCREVTSCENSRKSSKTWALLENHRPAFLKSSIAERFNRPLQSRPPTTTMTPTTTKMEIKQVRQRPSTRTIKFNQNSGQNSQFGMVSPQRQRSLFSLYQPAPRHVAPVTTTPTTPTMTTTQYSKYRNFYANNRGTFSAARQPLYKPLTTNTEAPFSYLYRRPTQTPPTPFVPTARPAPKFNSFYSHLQRLKTVSKSPKTGSMPAGFDLASELEKMRTDRVQLKIGQKKNLDPMLKLSPAELRQMLEDTHVTKVGKKLDPLVTLLEGDDNEKVPENLKADASRYLKKSVYGRKRRSFGRSYSSYQPLYQPTENIFDLLTKIRQSKGASTSADEAGFLTKKNGIVLLKCAPQRYKTAIPSSVDRLNPSLLAQILQERRGPMPVKRSRFATFG